MSKLSVAEAAEKFKVSKEAIHNRIRRGSLDCVIEHGMKYVLIDEPATTVPASVPSEDKYYSYIEEENAQLKEKINKLEKQNSRLRDQREEMLLLEKQKIEQIYKERDEQLKQVLHTISTKFLPQLGEQEKEDITQEVVDVVEVDAEPIKLKAFLKLKDFKPAKTARIKNRFKRLVGQDVRVFRKDGKIYIDPNRYDYSDLLD